MFAVPIKQVEVLGQALQVKPLAVAVMLDYRAKYNALADDDLPGSIALMRGMIQDAVHVPSITDADLDPLDIDSLRTLFGAVASACGLAEGNAGAGRTTA